MELGDKDSHKDNSEEKHNSQVAELNRRITEIASVKTEEQGFLSSDASAKTGAAEDLYNHFVAKLRQSNLKV